MDGNYRWAAFCSPTRDELNYDWFVRASSSSAAVESALSHTQSRFYDCVTLWGGSVGGFRRIQWRRTSVCRVKHQRGWRGKNYTRVCLIDELRFCSKLSKFSCCRKMGEEIGNGFFVTQRRAAGFAKLTRFLWLWLTFCYVAAIKLSLADILLRFLSYIGQFHQNKST